MKGNLMRQRPRSRRLRKAALIASFFNFIFRHRRLIICLLLLVLTSVAYWQVRTINSLPADDDLYVYENPSSDRGLPGQG